MFTMRLIRREKFVSQRNDYPRKSIGKEMDGVGGELLEIFVQHIELNIQS